MARPGSTPGAPPGNAVVPPPTRQQLDDLDALLQRMLELPVSPSSDEGDEGDEGEGPAATAPRMAMLLEPPVPSRPAEPPEVPEPVDAPPGNLVLSDPVLPRPAPPRPPAPPTAAVVKPPVVKPAVVEPAAMAAPVAARLGKTSADVAPPGSVGTTEPARPVARAESVRPRPGLPATGFRVASGPVGQAMPSRVPLVLRPLVGLNRLFDRASFVLGPAGRALRRSGGRAMLGLLGLALLGAAAGLVVLGRFGWTW